MTEYKIIDMLRMRMGMYVGRESPSHLNSYLAGYRAAEIDYRFIPEEPSPQEPSFYYFDQWVANKFDYSESTSGWANMIEDQRVDKKEALLLFYELLDEYRGIKHQQIARIIFDHEDKIDRGWRGYSRLKRVRGTFEEVFKPSPKELIVRRMNFSGGWFQMLARSDREDVLFAWSHEELERVYKRATEIFGIDKSEWIIEEESNF